MQIHNGKQGKYLLTPKFSVLFSIILFLSALKEDAHFECQQFVHIAYCQKCTPTVVTMGIIMAVQKLIVRGFFFGFFCRI